MTALAEDCIEIGQTQTAADILAYILCQIDADSVTLERADELFAELEGRDLSAPHTRRPRIRRRIWIS